MISASLYITVCSAKNRMRKRLARLREPRYLLGAVVGGLYFYLSFFARGRSRQAAARRGRPPAAAAATAAIAASGPAVVGAALLVLATVAWVLPFDSGLLEFSDAETDLLFPAPVTRRQLLLHRLLRSQVGILFGSAIVALAWPAAGWARLRMSVAMWLLFVAMRVYFTAVGLARNRAQASLAARAAAAVPFAACLAATLAVGIAIARTFAASPLGGIADLADRILAVATHGIPAIALWPTTTLARPFFAGSPAQFGAAMAAALAVCGALVAWMLASDGAFQDAASRLAARRAQKAGGARAAAVRARATGLSLALTGPTELALFWKNGVQTLRLTGITAIRIGVAAIAVCVAVSSMVMNTMHLRGGAAVACAVAMAVAAFTAVLGPQVVRTDLRTDLLHLELLKTWPVRPATVVRGEMAWPAAMLTIVGWIAVGCAAAFSPAAFPRTPALTRAAMATAAALLMPGLVFAQYLVQNAAALAFPAWVPLGNQRPRGVDAMGQRIIMLGGALLSVVVLFIPGALVGAAIWFGFQAWLGALVAIPASLLCTVVVLLEVLAATEMLGPLYERLDLLAVERTE